MLSPADNLTGENPPTGLARSPHDPPSSLGRREPGFQSARGAGTARGPPYRVAAVELCAFGQAGLGLGSALHLLHDALDVASGDPVEEHGWGAEGTRVVFCSAPHYFHIHARRALSSSEGRRGRDRRGCAVQERRAVRGTQGRRERGKKKEADRVESGLLGERKRRRGKKKEKPRRLPEDVQKTNTGGGEGDGGESYGSVRSSY